jgi:hypothetical protein
MFESARRPLLPRRGKRKARYEAGHQAPPGKERACADSKISEQIRKQGASSEERFEEIFPRR